MNEVTLRKRIVVLVIAALLSVAGASATAATVADDAHAAIEVLPDTGCHH